MTSAPARLRRLALLALAPCAVIAAAAPAAQAGWSRPFALMAPASLDVTPPQLTVSAAGDAAAGFGLQDVDSPGSAQAQLAVRSADGSIAAARPIPGVAAVLAAADVGRSPLLLAGTAAAGDTCCTTVEAVPASPAGIPGAPQVLLRGVDGQTLGRLVSLGGGRTLAVVATGDGVWSAIARGAGRFGRLHRLAGPARSVETLAAAALGGGASALGWVAVPGSTTIADPRTITLARGARGGTPVHPVTAVTVAPGHGVDEIAVGARPHGATVAWIESWSDRRGAHALIALRDDAPHAATAVLGGGAGAAGLQFGSDAAGDQALAWSSCRADGSCTVMLSSRRAGRSPGPPRSLGAIDAGQVPALAMGSDGATVLAWTRGGVPYAVSLTAGRAPGSPHRLSSTTYAFDIGAAVGPGGERAVVWSQGTLHPSVVGAVAPPG